MRREEWSSQIDAIESRLAELDSDLFPRSKMVPDPEVADEYFGLLDRLMELKRRKDVY